MNLKPIIACCFLTVRLTCLCAQQSLNASGGQATGTGGSVSYSIGQIDFTTFTGSGAYITQGVQQPMEILIALPVQLLNFNARLNNKQTSVSWTTANEYNNHHFDLERSSSAGSFKLLSTINSKGNNSSAQNYQYTDPAPFTGATYYRLKQVDKDNHFTYSSIVMVRLNIGNSAALTIYPNPVKTNLNVTVNASKERDYTFLLLDMNGKQVGSKKVHCTIGDNMLTWNIGYLPAGRYTLNAVDEENMTTPVIKQ